MIKLKKQYRRKNVIKLKKQDSAKWQRSAFTANWVVAEDASIAIQKADIFWYAYQGGQKIAHGWTRAELLKKLEEKRPELAV